jgi:hypothetical protein
MTEHSCRLGPEHAAIHTARVGIMALPCRFWGVWAGVPCRWMVRLNPETRPHAPLERPREARPSFLFERTTFSQLERTLPHTGRSSRIFSAMPFPSSARILRGGLKGRPVLRRKGVSLGTYILLLSLQPPLGLVWQIFRILVECFGERFIWVPEGPADVSAPGCCYPDRDDEQRADEESKGVVGFGRHEEWSSATAVEQGNSLGSIL